VLERVGYGGLKGRSLRTDGFGLKLRCGWGVEPCGTGGVCLVGRPLRRERRRFVDGFGCAAAIGKALGLLVVEVILGAAATG
jgi:hypothetical protein